MTTYKNLMFNTPLEATWAAFFDLVGWQWTANPAPIKDWKPDFIVTFPCGHSECCGSHTILVSVLPVSDISTVMGHPALAHEWSVENPEGNRIADAGALFGNDPTVSYWVMSHGAGGGQETVEDWINNNPATVWREAQTKIHQFKD